MGAQWSANSQVINRALYMYSREKHQYYSNREYRLITERPPLKTSCSKFEKLFILFSCFFLFIYLAICHWLSVHIYLFIYLNMEPYVYICINIYTL